ncbi:MAG: alpha/beta fold hydrolase [Acidobacteriia bacterium]|nr:alpha/beta fold hydrolase [Terriglobia bacterium]
MGTLDMGVQTLRLVFHITNTEDGLMATWDSLDQDAKGMPVTSVTRDGASLKIELKASAARFEGKIDPDRATIAGTFTQFGTPRPLVLARVDAAGLRKAATPPRRPQTPAKPYPYREEELFYENGRAGIRLAATLTIPQGKGPFPAVLLITGSGPQDRDESLKGHKPFLVLADYLTRQGIAVLRADDRGVAKSGGIFAPATTADFATDTEAGVAYLQTRSEVDPHRIGLIGHSEGGTIAPMVAARNRDIAFIVMLAGAGVRGDEVLVAQVAAGNEAAGMSHADAQKVGAGEREILNVLENEKDPAKRREKLAGLIAADRLDAQIAVLTSPWFRYFLTYDPAPALRKVTCPVLALIGGKDTQVPPGQNLPAIRKALEEGGNRHFEAAEMPGLNHLFQTARTGSVPEYEQIEETISPAVLEKIASWIRKQ